MCTERRWQPWLCTGMLVAAPDPGLLSYSLASSRPPFPAVYPDGLPVSFLTLPRERVGNPPIYIPLKEQETIPVLCPEGKTKMLGKQQCLSVGWH